MSSQVFTNGSVLNSSALTPEQFATILQPVILQILGITVDPKNPGAAYSAVRVAWQPQGQPSWAFEEDVCIIRATALDATFSQVRDQTIITSEAVGSVTQQMFFTQAWNGHLTFYGPNCYDHARLVISAMTLDWVRQALEYPPPPATSNIYVVPKWKRPSYIPENFQGRWWKRTDIDLTFYELAIETTDVASAASSQITVVTDSGITDTINVSA